MNLLQILDHAGLEALDRDPTGWIGSRDAQRIAIDTLRLLHERRDTGFHLLTHALRVAVIVQIPERHHDRRQPRHAAYLAGPEDAVDVHDLLGRDGLADDAAPRIEDQHAAGMIGEQPVRHAVAVHIELHPFHHVAVD